MPYEEIASYESVFNDIKHVLEQGRRARCCAREP